MGAPRLQAAAHAINTAAATSSRHSLASTGHTHTDTAAGAVWCPQVGVHPHELDSVLRSFETRRGEVDLELFRSTIRLGASRRALRPSLFLHMPQVDSRTAPAPPYRGVTRYIPTFNGKSAPGPF